MYAATGWVPDGEIVITSPRGRSYWLRDIFCESRGSNATCYAASGLTREGKRFRNEGNEYIVKQFAEGNLRGERELKASEMLQQLTRHRNLLVAREAFRLRRNIYIVLPKVEAPTAGELVASRPLTAGQTAAVIEDVARGVTHANSARVYNADITPSNIFVFGTGDVRSSLEQRLAWSALFDFDVCAGPELPEIDRNGLVTGTIGFIAPENVRGDHLRDEKTQVFGLGATAYMLLTGKPVYEKVRNKSVRDIFLSVLESDGYDPRNEDPFLGQDIADAVLNATKQERDERFSSPLEFSTALSQAAASFHSEYNLVNQQPA